MAFPVLGGIGQAIGGAVNDAGYALQGLTGNSYQLQPGGLGANINNFSGGNIPTSYNSNVLGASTYQPPSTQTYGPPAPTYGPPAPTSNPSAPQQNNSSQPNVATQQAQAAGQVSAAQIQAAQDMYNNLRAQIDAQKGDLQNTYNQGLSDLNTQIAQAQAQGTQQKSDLNNTANNAINTAYENYRSMLGQNNRMAGAFGGLNSGLIEANNQAGRDYGNNVSSTQNDLTSRVQSIDQNMLAMNQQAEAQKKSLADQLQNGILKISLDENANDFQKADAIQKIQGDYASQLAQINSQQQQLLNQLAVAKQTAQTYMAMYNQAGAGFNPMASAASSNQFINPAQLGTSGPGMVMTGSNSPVDLSKILGNVYGTDINTQQQ